MHILSDYNRSEFLACPQLIRFDYAHGSNGFETTLLIKGGTLLLKYVVLGVPMRLAFAMYGERLIYAVQVFDDGDNGGILWSVVEREEELNAIRGLAHGEPVVSFLFNELAVSVSWNNLSPLAPADRLSAWVEHAALGNIDHRAFHQSSRTLFENLHHHSDGNDDWLVFDIGGQTNWKRLYNHFITAGASASLIDLFDNDEGNQQEQLGVWLTDNLQPTGAYHSPQVPKGAGTRELTDILLSYQFGATLIESKTLSVLTRDRLPDRAKLTRDVSAHIDKAFGQLRGAIRALRSGATVRNLSGDILSIEREKPAHAVVLIPDLDLVEDSCAYGRGFMSEFMGATGGFPHLLDVAELLRVVQAAEMISARSTTTTPMMAFDYCLMQRAEKAAEAGTLCFEMVFRFAEEEVISN